MQVSSSSTIEQKKIAWKSPGYSCQNTTSISGKNEIQCLKKAYYYFSQLAQLLPMEENFLLLFRFDNPLDSSVEFMKVL